MTQLEDLKPALRLAGIVPGQSVTIVDVTWHGTTAVELVYKRPDGELGTQLLFRHDEAGLELDTARRAWRFDADHASAENGAVFQLVAEAYRIRLAHLFDPVLAVHTSLIEPLPHQITGVYGEMLPRHPLRFLLADDPGAGKTIMAGLLIKELIVRGDVQRCLICVPGNLADQWQDELWFKFQLRFDILTRESFAAAVSGNPFLEKDRVIIRLDQIARNAAYQDRLTHTDWDLVIVDEAHKMSAHYWSGELEETRRYKLGKLLRNRTRHFLLMTATPHNGKEEDFQLFLALLDADRFEGRFREGVHQVDVSDLMRRMVKEDLYRFDSTKLFPERRAYTVSYPLSPAEERLYTAVTQYVREEFDRAEQLLDNQRRGTVGFALTILQRRLASSPEAIYQSLKRRRQRLEKRLTELGTIGNADVPSACGPEARDPPLYDPDYLDDLDDAPAEEVETVEAQVLDSATTALTIAELEAEIATLEKLEAMAYEVRRRGTDRKWEELANLIQDDAKMTGPHGRRRKLVIFTEHLDTLHYLWRRISTLFGREDMLVAIHGSVPRKERRAIEDRFRNDPHVVFLLATDAAGEGINLQRAHLMINYDLPWNPNRLEQRFGRIHRIGQTEVCHLWNLVAEDTREGQVYKRLLQKLETESAALQGKVFNVMGDEGLFQGTSLRKLLLQAIRYGDRPDVRARLEEVVEHAFDPEHVRALLEAESLATHTMDTREIMRIREDMERYAARRLQPYYIQAFFRAAFARLGGSLAEREPGRYRISYVPAHVRQHAKAWGTVVPVWETYDRVCFDKALIHQQGAPQADFLCPGHPLLDTVIDMVLDQYATMLRAGAVLVDETDPGQTPRALFFLEQAIVCSNDFSRSLTAKAVTTNQRAISREVHFVEIDTEGHMRAGGYAPYIDYRPATDADLARLSEVLRADWLAGDTVERQVLAYAIEHLVPPHLARVRERRETRIDKTLAAVHARLTQEINYWDARAAELRRQANAASASQRTRHLNADLAQRRADDLAARLKRRTAELHLERQISATPPVIIGGALVVPLGLLLGEQMPAGLRAHKITEKIALQAVMQAEIALGHHPRDVSEEKLGYDIESRDGQTGRLRFIEVKGRRAGARDVTLYRSEILTGLNQPEHFILALVEVDDNDQARAPRYVRQPFEQEPDSFAVSVNYDLQQLLARSASPR